MGSKSAHSLGVHTQVKMHAEINVSEKMQACVWRCTSKRKPCTFGNTQGNLDLGTFA
jgi:hypothetical protein